MIVTEKYIKTSESSEYIGIDLPYREIIFSNPNCILCKRFESYNGIVIWRQNVGYDEFEIMDVNIIERFENGLYKDYIISQRIKKINSL